MFSWIIRVRNEKLFAPYEIFTPLLFASGACACDSKFKLVSHLTIIKF